MKLDLFSFHSTERICNFFPPLSWVSCENLRLRLFEWYATMIDWILFDDFTPFGNQMMWKNIHMGNWSNFFSDRSAFWAQKTFCSLFYECENCWNNSTYKFKFQIEIYELLLQIKINDYGYRECNRTHFH